MDAPGPWGTGPFILSKGFSSIQNVVALIDSDPFALTWLTAREIRTPQVVLEANPYYWNKQRGPRLQRVIFKNDLTIEQAIDLCSYTVGNIDLVKQVPPNQALKVKESPYAKLEAVNAQRVLVGVFNRFQDRFNFNQKNVRLAFNLAVDRIKIISEGLCGYGHLLPSVTPPWSLDFPENLEPRETNPVLAKQLLLQSGTASGTLRIASNQNYANIAYLMADDLQKNLGIKVQVTVIPKDNELEWLRVLVEKKLVPCWDIYLTDLFGLFSVDSPVFFHRELLGHDGALRVGPEIEQFNKLYTQFAREINLLQRIEIAKEIDRYVFEEALTLSLCCPQDLYAVNNEVLFRAYRSTFEFAETEVTPNHWSRRV